MSSVSLWGDPGLEIHTDDARVATLASDVDVIHCPFENVDIPIAGGQWHDYVLVSADMHQYALYVDGSLAHQGWFADRYLTSYALFGDIVRGAASEHSWDYWRFGVLSTLPGDLDCDGAVDFGDINPFVAALTNGTYAGCWPDNADINGDGSIDFGDINPFVALLSGGRQ